MNKPVLLITFNRLECLRKVFAAVAAAKPPKMYLASDGPRAGKVGEHATVEAIRQWMLENLNWPCEVHTRFLNENSGGCGLGVSGAITWFFQYEKDGIILEDDCIPSPTFFEFCEACLDRYADDRRVWMIGGYSKLSMQLPSSYCFVRVGMIWGWPSWSDRWASFDLKKWKYDKRIFKGVTDNEEVQERLIRIMESGADGMIDTWDYQWVFNIYANRGLCVIPKESLITNCGLDGIHYQVSEEEAQSKGLNVPYAVFSQIVHPKRVELNKEINERIFTEVLFPGCSPTLPLHKRIVKKVRKNLVRMMKKALPASVIGWLRCSILHKQ